MAIPNETILTRPLGSSTAASKPKHYVRLGDIDGTTGQASSTFVYGYMGTTGNTSSNETSVFVIQEGDIVLPSTGFMISFSAQGVFANNTNEKHVRLYVGNYAIDCATGSDNTNNSWSVFADVFCDGSEVVPIGAFSYLTADGFKTLPLYGESVGVVLSDVKITVQGVSTNDIVCYGATVNLRWKRVS